ncbi:MAG TPA: hypothetical protein VKF36_07225 [Syntrophorhabdales bacterium]|nr:hypothetical protein [Syntrophorhabdales bacterium]
MKRFIWLATLSFVLLMAFGMDVQAQPQEVTEVVTITGYVTPKILPLDEGRVRANYEFIGIVLSDTGSGLFHEATSRVLGGLTAEKGKFNDEQGCSVFNLRNGDKVFFTFTGAGEIKPGGGGEEKIAGTITGGTGACAGIKGSSTFTGHGLRPALEGIGQFYSKGTIKYTLP